ncbi:MAG TPA: hypothetical protein VFH20_13470, partial [Propionibacteriaceae bacterium]|nr:hypothetical protein [Propionibacteriaceae bacterium]
GALSRRPDAGQEWRMSVWKGKGELLRDRRLTCAAMVGRHPALDQQQPGGCGRDPRRAGGDRVGAAGGTYLLTRAFGATVS